MKICSDNINLSLEAKHIDKKSNLKCNVKQNNKLLGINIKNNKNAGSTVAEMMKQKQQLEQDIIDLQKKQEEYALKVKTEMDEIEKQIAGLEDSKNQIIKEDIDDIDTLNEVSRRLNGWDENKDKNLEDNDKVSKDKEKELEDKKNKELQDKKDKKNETVEKLDKENKVQASDEDKEMLHKLLNKVKNNSKQGAKDLKEIQKQIQDLRKQIEKLKADLKASEENTQKEIESIQKEIDNLNNTSKETSLSGNIVDEYR